MSYIPTKRKVCFVGMNGGVVVYYYTSIFFNFLINS